MAKSNKPTFPLINTTVKAPRVPAPQYKDALGTVTNPGHYATRIGSQFKTYDGRLARAVDNAPEFKQVKRSPHQIREIVKGVMLVDRHYMTAKADEVFAAVAYQLLGGSASHAWLAKMFAQLPIARIQNAIRDMRNRDGDVEYALQSEWLARKRLKTPKTKAQAKKVVANIRKAEWLAQAKSAVTMADRANVMRTKLTRKLQRLAPELVVVTYKNKAMVKRVGRADFEIIELAQP